MEGCTSFNIQMPDFNAPDFTGDIVVPGGGRGLKVVVDHHGPQGQSEGQQEAELTFDQRVANIKAGMMDMMGGHLADVFNCAQKELEVACKNPSFHKKTFLPM